MQLFDAIASEVDVESLMHQLRSSVSESQTTGRLFGAGASSGHCAKRDAVLTQLSEVERHAAVGTIVPQFERFGRIKRSFARFTARAVLYLARIITAPQRQVNFGMLQALRATLACLKEEEAARLELQARVQLLDRTLAALRAQIEPAASQATDHESSGRHSGVRHIPAPHR